MNKRFALIMAACIVVFGVFLLFVKKEAKAPTTSNSSGLSSHTIGEGKSGVVLVEYGDFQCSACWQYEPVMEQVREKYKDQITFQFRNYPLVELHPNALIGARAAEAASLQGKFWEMHDLLFEHAHRLDSTGHVVDIEWTATKNPDPFFESYAKQLELDTEKFKTDLKSSRTNDAVQADRTEAQRLKFTGTPSFVLDGETLDNPQADLDWFSAKIDAAIKAKTGH